MRTSSLDGAKARLVRVALFAGLLVLGTILVRGVTEMLERAVHGTAPANVTPVK